MMWGPASDRSRGAAMPTEITQAELAKIRDWANCQLTIGGEPPWSVFLLTRLSETIEALLAGMAATGSKGPPRAARPEAAPRLVVSNTSQDGGADRRLEHKTSKPRLTEPAI